MLRIETVRPTTRTVHNGMLATSLLKLSPGDNDTCRKQLLSYIAKRYTSPIYKKSGLFVAT
jgi:hypothetical protein